MSNLSGLAMPILVSAALKSTVVLGTAWLVALALRGRSAAARHLVWTAAAAALLALPFLAVSLPMLHIGAAGAILPVDLGVVFRAAGIAGSGVAGTRSAAPAGTTRLGAPAPVRPLDWKTGLMLVWGAGVAISLAQMLAAWAGMGRLRRRATPYPERERARALAEALGIRHEVDILETAPGAMPMTFGLLRPVIFFSRASTSSIE